MFLLHFQNAYAVIAVYIYEHNGHVGLIHIAVLYLKDKGKKKFLKLGTTKQKTEERSRPNTLVKNCSKCYGVHKASS